MAALSITVLRVWGSYRLDSMCSISGWKLISLRCTYFYIRLRWFQALSIALYLLATSLFILFFPLCLLSPLIRLFYLLYWWKPSIAWLTSNLDIFLTFSKRISLYLGVNSDYYINILLALSSICILARSLGDREMYLWEAGSWIGRLCLGKGRRDGYGDNCGEYRGGGESDWGTRTICPRLFLL